MSAKKGLYLLLVLILLFHAFTLSFAPPPSEAEAWMVEPGWHLFNKGEFTSEIFDNMLEVRNGSLGQGNLLHIFFGLAATFFENKVTSGRGVSFFAAIILLAVLFKLTKEISGEKAAFYAVFTMLFTTAFYYSSHLTRASIFLGTLHISAFYLLRAFCLAAEDKKNRYAFLTVITASSTLMFHFSGIIIALSITIAFFYINRHKLFSKNVLFYTLGGLLMVVIWWLIHVAPLGLDIYFKKLSLLTGYTAVDSNKINLLKIPIKYFFVSKLTFFYLFAFLLSIRLILASADKHKFLIKYIVLYFAVTLIFNDEYENHKAIVFIPFFSLCIAIALSRIKKESVKDVLIIKDISSVFVLLVILSVGFGALKQAIYFKRSLSVNYDEYADEIKSVVPVNSVVLGSPNLWFSLSGRNKLLGGSYYISRAYNYWDAFPKFSFKDRPVTLSLDDTKKIIDFLISKDVSYIVANKYLNEGLERNGFFHDAFKSNIILKKKIFTNFYSKEIFGDGFVFIYKINA